MEDEFLDDLLECAISLVGRPTTFDVTKACFDKQRAFIKDPHKLKSLFCTRRAAKSYTGGLYLTQEAENNPGVNCLYIGLTRLSAKGIIWKDVLKDIDKRNNLGMQFNGTELTATTQNGAVIWVTGADADEDEMEKLLGKKYKLVILDEAASFSIDLRRLIYGVLKPATIDQGGTICMMGTSGNLTQGLFFDVTQGKEPGWKLFEWSAFDNPYIAKQWQEELNEIKANRPLFMETPLFKQWYLNEWVIDDDKLVYRYSPSRNDLPVQPHYSRGEWQYILGVDLGYDPDPSAFSVAAFHENDPNLYFLETYKRTQMDVTDVANFIKGYQSQYNLFRIVIDGANKQAVEEIQRRHGIPLTAADKNGKPDFIQIMNSEFIQGKIKVLPACGELKEEYQKLIWEMDGDRIKLPRKEHSSCANHLTDAALYAWRFCYTYQATTAKPIVNIKDKSQWIAHTQKMMEDSLQHQIERESAQEKGEDLWNVQSMGLDENPLSYYVNKKRGR